MKTKKEILGKTQNVKRSKFVDRNTLEIEFNDGKKVIRLYDTDIITFAGNSFILNSGGFRTATTKDRITKFSPARINQVNRIWYLAGNKLFYDNCKINSKGELISKQLKNNIIEDKVKKLKKQIAKYCNLITKDNLPYPEAGDCWLCSMFDKDGKDNSHLFAHLKENYLHGSILVNAMREIGFSDTGISFYYQSKHINTFKRSVRKYLQKRLISGIAVK